ncbi:MAG: uracil-DNA glycosylase [Candidatus Magnetoovum sp. WYHC-5]|nr:uracil-DNA glycosylase [Candidatus Magnetoovum sp. WYHC-5]
MKEALLLIKEILIQCQKLGFDELPLQINIKTVIASTGKNPPTFKNKNYFSPSNPFNDKAMPEVPAEQTALNAISAEIGDCHRCKLHSGRKTIVFGEGNPHAILMFIGEGPGADEDAQGRPFVGRAGQLLTRLIERMGFKRSDVYIANIVKCRPPENRNPQADEIEACLPFLKKQIEAIAPKIIMALGSVPTQVLLQTDKKISSLRGQFFDYNDSIKLLPTFHPSYLLRNPKEKVRVWEDAKKALEFLGMNIPE